jgi:hypothetical protein
MRLTSDDPIIGDEWFQRPPANPTVEDIMDPEKWPLIYAEQRRQMNNECRPQVDALMRAGWMFEVVNADDDPWQWAWRRPPRRAGSQGMRFASTQQAYNSLIRGQTLHPENVAG